LLQSGFVKARLPESYRRTPALDLEPTEEDLFLKLAPSARRNVRAPAKRGFEILPLHDPIYSARIEELMRESFQRTGGSAVRLPWHLILRSSHRSPNRSRVVGLFEHNNPTPNGLVAFAWGCVNGNYVSYEAAASTRRTGLGNLALAYAPLWDLVLWAKRLGATWFDFGGVPAADRVQDDPLAGIADFKRFFCEDVVEVRDEWTLEPRPLRASVARAVSAAVERMRR
jgi:lipid II:glycine glycyltransferase (peptidoglycan interpeptide bridge formation enzyme)